MREFFPFAPRERLFNLKIIECGKCWRWELFISFPFLFLPLALPHSGSGIAPAQGVSRGVCALITGQSGGTCGCHMTVTGMHSYLLDRRWHSFNKSDLVESLSHGSSPGTARMLRPPYSLPFPHLAFAPPSLSCPFPSQSPANTPLLHTTPMGQTGSLCPHLTMSTPL